jgi:anaerobic selenocysteine-containing dehydrogenase
MKWISKEKRNVRLLPFVLAKTLGQSLNSAHLAAVWGLLTMYPQHASDELVRAGYELTSFLGDELFQKLLDCPEGILIGKLDPDKNLEKLRTPDKKIQFYIEEMADWIHEIESGKEKAAIDNREFPLVLVAGRHFPYTANSIMRDPAWNAHKTVCTALMNKEDTRVLGIEDGEEVWVTTETSRVKVPVEFSDIAVPGTVTIPHGFGLDYMGRDYGVNVNRLTKNTHRDRLAGTPLHRYVPCRVEVCGDQDAAA